MNLSRLFVERRQVSWVALVAVLVWGVVAYLRLPQRKDPEVIIKTAVVTTQWPGALAGDVEALVTRPIELTTRQVARVDLVVSTTRAGLSTVFVTLEDTVGRADLDTAWADLRARLELVERNLPPGVQPPRLNTNFGDTAAVTFSVASPPASEVEVSIREAAIRRALEAHRSMVGGKEERIAALFLPATGIPREHVLANAERYAALGVRLGVLREPAVLPGESFVAVDFAGDVSGLGRLAEAFAHEVLGGELPHPDARGPVLVERLSGLREVLEQSLPERLSWRELDEATKLLRDEIARMPDVSRVDRHGVVPERVYLLYSQERLASFGVGPRQIAGALKEANVTIPGGAVTSGRHSLLVDPQGAFADLDDLLDTVVGRTKDGHPVVLGDVVEVQRTYETPVSDASWLTWHDDRGWHRTRSVALAVQFRKGVQATAAGARLDAEVHRLLPRLPPGLVVEKTSDQPELVGAKISEFMRSLAEAVAIVIAVALLFMERRSAILVAASIPITLAMTFGFMDLLKLDLQQVSIAALIIALGLLVDDPVIASDAINREIAHGVPRLRAAWLGPTKLAKAILYATLTNTVAFAPLLLVAGTMGEFIHAIPMVVTISLVSSRIVSMTFMPFLGYYLLRGQRGYEAALEGEGRAAHLARKYNAVTEWMLNHKAISFVGFFVFLVLGLAPATQIRTQFFPEEAMERFYVHVRLPEGADVRATDAVVREAERIILEAEGEKLRRLTSFVGNGGPRWWSNVSPEPKNPAYALLILQAKNAGETMPMIGRLQRLLRARVPGGRFEVYRISSGKPAVTPVEVRITGPDETHLRRLAGEVKDLLRALPQTGDVADDWGAEALGMSLRLDEARASAAGVSKADLAGSSLLAFSGQPVTQLREDDQLIDVILRLRPAERGAADRIGNLYVWSQATGGAVPLEQVATVAPGFAPRKIVRRDLERTLTVGAIPKDGELASVLLKAAGPALAALVLPPGYRIALGGEHEVQQKAFANVSVALKVSVVLIFLTLVWQFAHVFKPLIVFAAIPFGLVGAVLGLTLTKTNFGFMAFLGVASLVGVIVSHIIVLFDFIEEARERGVELHRAVIDAGLVRLRPVLVTTLATVGGLIPLGLNGGPMWRQLVFVQIAGLLLATVVTKGVVPLLYVVFVETFKIVRWEREEHELSHESSPARVEATPSESPVLDTGSAAH